MHALGAVHHHVVRRHRPAELLELPGSAARAVHPQPGGLRQPRGPLPPPGHRRQEAPALRGLQQQAEAPGGAGVDAQVLREAPLEQQRCDLPVGACPGAGAPERRPDVPSLGVRLAPGLAVVLGGPLHHVGAVLVPVLLPHVVVVGLLVRGVGELQRRPLLRGPGLPRPLQLGQRHGLRAERQCEAPDLHIAPPVARRDRHETVWQALGLGLQSVQFIGDAAAQRLVGGAQGVHRPPEVSALAAPGLEHAAQPLGPPPELVTERLVAPTLRLVLPERLLHVHPPGVLGHLQQHPGEVLEFGRVLLFAGPAGR
mmetsp:Transcript_2976/g.8143  ORF Transcript_2976/g.8143 Transcript_2976/m.8143 type:complete len:312 (-) Transcript_2976:957-1892(-)